MTEEMPPPVIRVEDARQWLPHVYENVREERVCAFIRRAIDDYEWSDEYARSMGEILPDDGASVEIRRLYREVAALRAEHAESVKAVTELVEMVKPHIDDLIPTIESLMNHPMLKLLGGGKK